MHPYGLFDDAWKDTRFPKVGKFRVVSLSFARCRPRRKFKFDNAIKTYKKLLSANYLTIIPKAAEV